MALMFSSKNVLNDLGMMMDGKNIWVEAGVRFKSVLSMVYLEKKKTELHHSAYTLLYDLVDQLT